MKNNNMINKKTKSELIEAKKVKILIQRIEEATGKKVVLKENIDPAIKQTIDLLNNNLETLRGTYSSLQDQGIKANIKDLYSKTKQVIADLSKVV